MVPKLRAQEFPGHARAHMLTCHMHLGKVARLPGTYADRSCHCCESLGFTHQPPLSGFAHAARDTEVEAGMQKALDLGVGSKAMLSFRLYFKACGASRSRSKNQALSVFSG